MFKRLGIADQVRDKAKRIESERVGAVVARGDAEIGFQQLSELMHVPGIDIIGSLPPDVQVMTTFSAGVGSASANPADSRAFITYLTSPAAEAAIRRHGMEPA